MTTCPSGVHYMHLVDHAREYIEQTYKRPCSNACCAGLLAQILPYPMRFRLAMLGRRSGALCALMPMRGCGDAGNGAKDHPAGQPQ
jgi:glycolate oxidase iron-sulfur subunit